MVDGRSDGPDTVHGLVPFHLVLVFHLTGADQPIRPAQLKLAVWNEPWNRRRKEMQLVILPNALLTASTITMVGVGVQYNRACQMFVRFVADCMSLGGQFDHFQFLHCF